MAMNRCINNPDCETALTNRAEGQAVSGRYRKRPIRDPRPFPSQSHRDFSGRQVKVEKNLLHVEDIDVVDGMPLLDIKPYVPEFDVREADRIGWLEAARTSSEKTISNTRFARD